MKNQVLQDPQKILNVLHSRIYDKTNRRYGWVPHPGQVKIGKALFADGKKKLFIQCGRKFGKTEFVIYTLLRWAVLNPDSVCLYLGASRKEAKNIVWRRIKTFVPKEFLEGNSNTAFKENELRVKLWNGSEIVIDGTTDSDSSRGIEPHLVVYDEYKDHKSDYHEGMEPNLEVHNAPVIFIGTPPDHENHFTEMAEAVRKDPDGFYIEAPSTEGPIYSRPRGRIELEKIKQRCLARGDMAYFMREYEAKFVLGGSGSVFPMWNRDLHTVEDQTLKEMLKRDGGKLQWFVITDPGTTTCHASLVAVLNPYTRQWFVLEEIYEKNPIETTTRRMWPRIEALMKKWNPNAPIMDNTWYKGYDEAAAWFAMEVMDSYGNISLTPTNKKMAEKENGLSLIKDQLLEKRLFINKNCTNFIWEIERYVKDKNGQIPKKNDHLIDIMRYLNNAAGFQFLAPQPEPDAFEKRGWRAVRPADEYDLEDYFE